MPRVTFLNGDNDLKERGLKYLSGVQSDMESYMKVGLYQSEDVGYVDNSEDGQESYLRLQFSWGGPSDELRFYLSPSNSGWYAYKIEYVFLDWFVGVGFDVSNEDWAKWVYDQLNELGIPGNEIERALAR